MGKATRAGFIGVAGVIGFALGAAMLGYAALAIGSFALSFAPGGIHSDWSIVVLLGIVAGVSLGSLLGTWAAVRLVKFLLREKQ
ncbi:MULTISPECIES: hypothetical protein [unclassified Bradyrhizobium]|uniref:hypothetical protein n=1 Tax=unclassified Bradyrhizobium TaxID=2631580 RepID=UPI0028EFF991|nr:MULTISPECIES: hypothetical protein [unclassified Bradyrhizobium]